MLFQVESIWLVSVVLVAIRLGVLTYVTPLDALGHMPVQVKVILIFVMAIFFVSVVEIELPALPTTAVHFGLLGLYELVKGLVLVLGIYTALGAFMVAGQLLDSQTGFAAANILNPTTHTQEPMMGILLQLLAVVLFFLMDAHHLLLEAIAYSFSVVPIGQSVVELNSEQAIYQFGLMFIYGLMLAAPTIAMLIMVDVGLAMMSRTMPQMNIYFVILPLKIFLGLLSITFSLKYLLPLVEKIFFRIFEFWGAALM